MGKYSEITDDSIRLHANNINSALENLAFSVSKLLCEEMTPDVEATLCEAQFSEMRLFNKYRGLHNEAFRRGWSLNDLSRTFYLLSRGEMN